MTDFANLLVADRGQPARPIHLVDKDSYPDWVKPQPAADRALLTANRFDGKSGGSFVLLPRDGEFEVVATVKDAGALSPWCLARLAESLPEGTYQLAKGEPGEAALGWLLAQHRFDAFRSKGEDQPAGARVLLTADVARIERLGRVAKATALVRDLVNRPAGDLGPAELEQAVRAEAERAGATVIVTAGKGLAQGYPLIAAVGAAATAERAPRLIELEWGRPDDPRVAIIGKGVCFDTGGLNLKPGSGMRLMKKDVGGAAHALSLARLIMAERLPVRLHLLIPAVENAVSAAAYRPGDVIKSRHGLFVEIDNTDAEGRLVLADAITKAGEDKPELIIDFATLTGAARVALGPDLPALFVNNDALADEIARAADQADDPLWRLPLWEAYDEMLKSDIADLVNSAPSPMAGSIVAAMFLKRFVPGDIAWAHLDTYAWRDGPKPGRPKGGEALGLRAIHALLERRYPRAPGS